MGEACCGQEYIENENARLEREQQFWAKEIVVKIEYKYCPNLTIIDTPGAYASANVCCKMWSSAVPLTRFASSSGPVVS